MKKSTTIWIYPLALAGVLFILTNSCTESDNTPDYTVPSLTAPVLTTSAMTSITQTTAVCGGNITSGGGSAVTVRGVCWSTSQSFTIDNSDKTTDGAGAGSFISVITGLNPGITYYVRAYATNSTGTGYGNLVKFNTLTPPFTVGQSYGGGIIFYIDGTGQHGLIAAISDQSSGMQWGCYGNSIPGTSTEIGMGQDNTTAIVNGCSTAGIAARICDNLVLNGYNDWFLPSKDEMNQMYLHKTVIGGFASNLPYWSSSEYSANYAWNQLFSDGFQCYSPKGLLYSVRAVRAF